MANNPIINNTGAPPAVQNPQVQGGSINSTWIQPKQLSDGDGAGTEMGFANGDTLSFFGATPVPQILQGALAGANGLLKVYATSQSPAAVTANTTSEVSMTVAGVATGDIVVGIVKPTAQAGLAVGTARVSTTNTIAASFGNVTGSTITPTTTETYFVVTASAALGFTAILSPASVAAATTVEQSFTVGNDVQVGMVVSVNKPTLQAGLLVTGARVAATGVVAIEFMNCTTATVITPTPSEVYSFFAARGLRLQPVMQRISATLTPAAVAANTTAEQTFTVNGLIASTAINVDPPSLVSGLALTGARVSAINTLALTFANVTAASATPPAGTYFIGFFPNVAPSAGNVNTQLAEMGVDGGRALGYYGLLSADLVE